MSEEEFEEICNEVLAGRPIYKSLKFIESGIPRWRLHILESSGGMEQRKNMAGTRRKEPDHADGAHQPHGRGENVHQVSHGILHRQQRVGVLFQGRENISECALYAHGRYDCITDKRSLNR